MKNAKYVGDFIEEIDFSMQVKCVVKCVIFQSYLPLFFWGKWGVCTWDNHFWSLLCVYHLHDRDCYVSSQTSQKMDALSVTNPRKCFPLSLSTESITLIKEKCRNDMTGEQNATLAALLNAIQLVWCHLLLPLLTVLPGLSASPPVYSGNTGKTSGCFKGFSCP